MHSLVRVHATSLILTSNWLTVSLSSPTEAVSDREFLGNGEWPVGPASTVSPESISIPSPPVEGVDHAPKMVYRMTARPRGMGNLVSSVKY